MIYPQRGDKVAVYYRHPRLDGTMAAAVAMAVFSGDYELEDGYAPPGSFDVDYIPAAHGKTYMPDVDIYDLVYVLDFSFSGEELFNYVNWNSGPNGDNRQPGPDIVVIDHHASSIKEIWEYREDIEDRHEMLVFDEGIELVLDTSKSGARLTFEYFSEAFAKKSDRAVPPAVLYVEDRDLWKFDYAFTKPFCAALGIAPMTPRCFSEQVLKRTGAGVTELVETGRHLLEAQAARIEKYILPNVYESRIFLPAVGYSDIYVVNTSTDISEAAQMIIEERGTNRVVLWHAQSDGYVKLDFRSSGPEYPVDALAKSFGGGGHPCASGARISLEDFLASDLI